MKLSELLHWLDAHWYALPIIGGVINAAWKAIPAPKRAVFERRFPRLANLLRFSCAVLPDAIKGVLSLRAAALGQAKPGALPSGPQTAAAAAAAAAAPAPVSPEEPPQ